MPAVTHKIWEMNKNLPTGAIKINLKGTSVGNGLTAPLTQYKYCAFISAGSEREPVSEKALM